MKSRIKVFSILAYALHLGKNLTRRNDEDFNLVGEEILETAKKAVLFYPYGKLTQKDVKNLNPVVAYAIDFGNAQRIEIQDIIQTSLLLTSIDDLLQYTKHKKFREHLLELVNACLWMSYLVDPELNHEREYDKTISFYHHWMSVKTYI